MTYLKTLILHNFRNYKRTQIELSPKINLFIGKNGQGKTNCLEAIGLFITGKSFRAPYLRDLIFHKEKEFYLKTHFVKNNIEQSLAIEYSESKKSITHNETTYSSFLPLIGVIQGVLFAGIFDDLIKGSPQNRRRFLDLQNAQIDPLYIHHLTHFQKALKERNCLLKQKKWGSLVIYEEIMAKSIPYLIQKRQENLKLLAKSAREIHQELSNLSEEIEITYSSPFNQKEEINIKSCLNLFESFRNKDKQMGHTQIGPHKDEVIIELKNKSAKKFGSEGQIQTLMTSIYLAEFRRLQNKIDEPPIFCLDDLGQNLDKERLNRLLKALENMGQVFITTPHLPNYSFKCENRVFEIEEGTVNLLNSCN